MGEWVYDEITGLMVEVKSAEEQATLDRKHHEEWAAQQHEKLKALGLVFGVLPEAKNSYERAVARALAASPALADEPTDHEPTIDPAWAVRGPGWWLVPYGWIGCAGHMVYDTGEVVALGSAHGIWPGLWLALGGHHPSPDEIRFRIDARNPSTVLRHKAGGI